MRADWPARRCILCLEESALSEEHLIPRALGGIFTCHFLCRACNSRFGSDAEAAAKSDPSILLAARKLHSDIPKLSQRLIESHPHFSTGEGLRISGYIQEGAFRVSPQERNDGSLILPTEEARKAITTMLERMAKRRSSALLKLSRGCRRTDERQLRMGWTLSNGPWRGLSSTSVKASSSILSCRPRSHSSSSRCARATQFARMIRRYPSYAGFSQRGLAGTTASCMSNGYIRATPARFMEYVMKRIPNVRRYRSDCSAALHTVSDSPDCISEDRDTRTRTGWRLAVKT